MNEQTRIIICGSPHSGKTVFATSLYTMLPQKYTSIIRACPDGEGVYSNNEDQEVILLTKRKGKMTVDFVGEVIERIKSDTSPIILIDVGGLPSKENEKIFSHADLAIILDKTTEGINRWRDFCKQQKLGILAEIFTRLGKPEITPVRIEGDTLVGTIFNLQRGRNKVRDKVMIDISKKIYEMALEKGLVQKGREALSADNVINMRNVAQELKMMKDENIEWTPDRANEIYYYVKGFAQSKKEMKVFESRANWVTGVVCESAQNSGVEQISLYDARKDKYVFSRKLKISDKLEGINVEGITKYEILQGKIELYIIQSESSTLMQFELNPNKQITEEDMSQIVLPNINPQGKLYISGRLPLWLFASVSRTYNNTEKSVLQPGIGFIQYASKSITQNLGKIETQIPDIDLNSFLVKVKQDVDIKQGGDGR